MTITQTILAFARRQRANIAAYVLSLVEGISGVSFFKPLALSASFLAWVLVFLASPFIAYWRILGPHFGDGKCRN